MRWPMHAVGLGAVLVTANACGERAAVEPPGGLDALALQIVAGDAQVGPPGAELPDPVVVQVVGPGGNAGVPHQVVNFRVVEGGGSVFAGVAETDARGEAAEYWTLGEPGPQRLEARAVSADGEKQVFAVFSAMAVEPAEGVFYDEEAFVAATGATAVVTFPSAGVLTPVPYVEHGVSLVSAAGFNRWVKDHTPVFAGNEFGVSGAENIDVTFDEPVRAVGLWMQDGYAVGNVSGCPDGRDSQFTFRFLSQGVEVALLTEDPPLDEAWFVGLASGASIDRLEIREVGSVVNAFGDPYCENDFVGSVLVGR